MGYRILIIFLAITTLLACEKAFMPKEPENTNENNFEHLWKTLDEKYSLFEFKGINWDSVYLEYRSRVNEDMSDPELFRVLASMMYELNDGHVNLIAPANVSRNWNYKLQSPENFSYTIIERHYLKDTYESTGGFRHNWLGETAYLYFSSFNSGVSSQQMNYLMAKYKDASGIIIDIRNNGGGSTAVAEFIASTFIIERDEPLNIRFKKGPEHDDFGEANAVEISPRYSSFNKPVAILINRSSYSAANYFYALMKDQTHTKSFGDTTGGGAGYPVYNELPNGWTFRYRKLKLA